MGAVGIWIGSTDEGNPPEGRPEVPWSGFLYESKNGEGRLAGRARYGFRIEFPEAVQGSMVVGYAAHFGMGEFETVEINM